MSTVSPMQRSLFTLRSAGYYCEITEHWNPHAKVRNDLFGFGDIIALRDREVCVVQTTTLSHMNERIEKILSHKNYETVKRAGIRILVHGWRKLKSGWACEEREL